MHCFNRVRRDLLYVKQVSFAAAHTRRRGVELCPRTDDGPLVHFAAEHPGNIVRVCPRSAALPQPCKGNKLISSGFIPVDVEVLLDLPCKKEAEHGRAGRDAHRSVEYFGEAKAVERSALAAGVDSAHKAAAGKDERTVPAVVDIARVEQAFFAEEIQQDFGTSFKAHLRPLCE